MVTHLVKNKQNDYKLNGIVHSYAKTCKISYNIVYRDVYLEKY